MAELWGAALGAGISVAGAVGGSLVSGAMSGGGGGGGMTGPPDFIKDLYNQMNNLEFPELNLPNIQFEPTMFNARVPKIRATRGPNKGKLVDRDLLLQPVRGPKELYGEKPKTVDYEDTAMAEAPQNVVWNPLGTYQNIVRRGRVVGRRPSGPTTTEGVSQALTDIMTANRERVAPGIGKQMDLGTQAINSWLQGTLPQDTIDQLNRVAAERTGGMVRTAGAGGGTAAANNLARNLGLTSMDIQRMGVQASPNWQAMAQSFTYSPGQVIQDRYQYDVLNANIDQFRASLAKGIDENRYTSNLTKSFMEAAPDPRYAGWLNDYMNITNMNNANALAAAQFNYGTQMQNEMMQYQQFLDAQQLKLAAGGLGASSMSFGGGGGGGMGSAMGSMIAGAGQTLGNAISSFGNRGTMMGPMVTGVNSSGQAVFGGMGSNVVRRPL